MKIISMSEKMYNKGILLLSEVGFRPIYTNDDNNFTIMFNDEKTSVCSVDFNDTDLASFNLVSPYLDKNKQSNNITEVLKSIMSMKDSPVRSITIDDLPLLSCNDKIRSMTIAEYFNFSEMFHSYGMSDDFWTRRLFHEAGCEYGSDIASYYKAFNSGSVESFIKSCINMDKAVLEGFFENPTAMLEEYNFYKINFERTLKLAKLEEMPEDIKNILTTVMEDSRSNILTKSK